VPGNRAMRDLARRDPARAALVARAPAGIQRVWMPSGGGAWEWKGRGAEDRKWFREGQGPTATYLFHWTRNEQYGNGEGLRRTAVQWAAAGVRVPEASAADALPTGEWDTNALGKFMAQQGLPGVCNALTSAYLAGLILPDEGKTGVTPENVAQVMRLKGVLDEAVLMAGQMGIHDAARVSQWFIRWAEGRGLGPSWLADPIAFETQDVRGAFQTHLRQLNPSHPSHGKAQAEVPPSVGWVDGHYRYMFELRLKRGFMDALGDFDANRDARGIVVAQMKQVNWRGREVPGTLIGHELAVSYHAASKSVVIHDQNTGKKTASATSAEDIAKALAAHMQETYVRNPPKPGGGEPVNHGMFQLRLAAQAASPKGAASNGL